MRSHRTSATPINTTSASSSSGRPESRRASTAPGSRRDRGSAEPIGFKSIQGTIAFTLFSLVVLVVIVIELVSYNLTEKIVRQNSEAYTLQLMNEVAANIDSYIRYMKNISSLIQFDQDVQRYFSAPTPAGRASGSAKIAQLLGSVTRARPDISLIALFGEDGRAIFGHAGLKTNPYVDPRSLEWYKAAVRADGAPVISASHVQNVVDNQYPWVISLSRAIKETSSGRVIAVLLVDLNFSVIRDLCAGIDLGARGYAFIVDDGGAIIFHPQQQLIYSNLRTELINQVLDARGSSFIAGSGDERRIYTIRTSTETGWKVVGVTYMSTLVSDREFIQIYYGLLGLACLLVVTILSILVSFRITRPIKMLVDSMEQAERGNFDTKVNIASSDEIGDLGRKFNVMIEKIHELMVESRRDQELKRKSEIAALQAQINPHFLYNTLDSVIWMAEGGRHEEVVQMVSSLSKLLRLSITRGDEMVPIAVEIEHIRHYLIIQKMRYRDKLDFEIDVPEELTAYKTPKILLQPLVENSIYHGIKGKRSKGMVRVSARAERGRVIVTIADNGVGMDEQTIAGLLRARSDEHANGGVGVRNVDERIKLYFGAEYGLQFESVRHAGTTVRVTLPVVR